MIGEIIQVTILKEMLMVLNEMPFELRDDEIHEIRKLITDKVDKILLPEDNNGSLYEKN